MPIDAVKGAGLGAAAVSAALKSAGEATGVGFDVLYNMARRESSLDPNARAKTSTAAGLFQFIEQTWLSAVKKHGARHGLADVAAEVTQRADGRLTVSDPARREAILNLRFDPAKAAALAAELVNENRAGLEQRLGRAVNDAEIYAAHFLGLAGATKLLSAPPDAEAAALLPKAAAANQPVFYKDGRARTVGEVIASIARSMNVAAPAPQTPQPAPEQKSALSIQALAARLHPEAPRQEAPPAARTPAHAPGISVPPLAELFALRMPTGSASLPPLAIAVLQALDPASLLGDRQNRDRAR